MRTTPGKNRLFSLKTLYDGHASLVDCVVREAIINRRSIVLLAKVLGRLQKMTLTPDDLSSRGIMTSVTKNDNNYRLIDYKWIADKQQQLDFWQDHNVECAPSAGACN